MLRKSGKKRRPHGGCVTALLVEFLDPFDRVPGNFTVWTLSNNGENMNSCKVPHATDDRWSIDSFLEMEHRLISLRSLVCDLLKTNQELRQALLKARSGVPNNQGS